jgi:hypothetical protein
MLALWTVLFKLKTKKLLLPKAHFLKLLDRFGAWLLNKMLDSLSQQQSFRKVVELNVNNFGLTKTASTLV